MAHALPYIGDHVVAFAALITTLGHIFARARKANRKMAIALGSAEKFVPLIVAALAKAADFEAGKPITLQVPADSITLDLTAEGFGRVTIGESGAVLTLTKA